MLKTTENSYDLSLSDIIKKNRKRKSTATQRNSVGMPAFKRQKKERKGEKQVKKAARRSLNGK